MALNRLLSKRLLASKLIGIGVLLVTGSSHSQNQTTNMNTNPKTSWFESSLNKLTASSEYQKRVVDEYWTSLPLPICRGKATGFVMYFGKTRKAPDGIREPQSPHTAVWVSYPESTIEWFDPTSKSAVISDEGLRHLRDKAAMEKLKERLKERGKWMRRHKALVDELLTQGWLFEATKNLPKQQAVANEWKLVLGNLIDLHFLQFYEHVAHDLTDWINKRSNG